MRSQEGQVGQGKSRRHLSISEEMARDILESSSADQTGGIGTPIEAETPVGSGPQDNEYVSSVVETKLYTDEIFSIDLQLKIHNSNSSMSLTTSVYEYPKENGRTYHGYRAGSYHWPNDPTEIDRLGFQYELFKYCLQGKNYFAPLSDPRQILDIGTGPGQWCIEMGDEFPNAEIQGTDLSPIQPSSVPGNVHFFVDDASEKDWVLPSDHFDFIHTRLLLGCFNDFRDIIANAFHHLKPGGYMESQEVMTQLLCDDGTMPDDWPVREWVQLSDDAAMKADRPLRIGNKLKRWYEAQGFVDVQEKIFKMPLNPWPKDKHLKNLGTMSEENWLSGLQGFTMAPFTRYLNWSKTEIDVFLVKVREAISDRNVHSYSEVFVVWGRKPETAAAPPSDPWTTAP